MNKKLELAKKIWNAVTTAVVALVVICAVLLLGAKVFGFKTFSVISGSMEPTYSVGDLLYVKEAEFEDIKVGDPITFTLNKDLTVATHRVVRIDTEKQCFYTKGDANADEDRNPVSYKNVIGVPKFSIPWLGGIADFVKTDRGLVTVGAVGVLLIASMIIPDVIEKKSSKQE